MIFQDGINRKDIDNQYSNKERNYKGDTIFFSFYTNDVFQDSAFILFSPNSISDGNGFGYGQGQYKKLQGDSVVATGFNTRNFYFIPKDTGTYKLVAFVNKKYQTEDSFNYAFSSPIVIHVVPNETLTISPIISIDTTNTKINWIWCVALVLLSLLSAAIAYYFHQKFKKFIDDINTKNSKSIIDTFNGNLPPREIEWKQKNQFIKKDSSLISLYKNLKQHIYSERLDININKTIYQTTKNLGTISPVYEQKIKPKKYIVLLQQKYRKSTQFYLFKYLIDNFNLYNVPVEYFIFNTSDKYIDAQQQQYNLQELVNAYQQHALIIFSDGYTFLNYQTNSIFEEINNELSTWKNKVLVTPIPYIDWSAEENILRQEFPIVPADLVGLLNIIQVLNDDNSFQNYRTYTASYLNFYKIEEVKNYLQDDDLFQWLCALAVYPKIYWQLILAIGYELFPSKVTYENLLKLVRIKWIHEASFPVDVRLDLLKILDETNEIKARTLILNLIKDELSDITEDMFTYEEREIQRYTQSFILFANNNEENKINKDEIKDDAENFMALHQTQNINDIALKVYINNKDKEWETPIKNSQPANEYIIEYNTEKNKIAEKEKNKLNNLRKIFSGIALLALSILYIFIFLYKNNTAIEFLEKIKFSEQQMIDDGLVTLQINKDDCYKKIMQNNSDTVRLIIKDTQTDSIQYTSIIENDTLNENIKLILAYEKFYEVTIQKGKIIQNGSFYHKTQNTYLVSINNVICDTSPTPPLDTVIIQYNDATQKNALS
jgi:hypothetical protein